MLLALVATSWSTRSPKQWKSRLFAGMYIQNGSMRLSIPLCTYKMGLCADDYNETERWSRYTWLRIFATQLWKSVIAKIQAQTGTRNSKVQTKRFVEKKAKLKDTDVFCVIVCFCWIFVFSLRLCTMCNLWVLSVHSGIERGIHGRGCVDASR